MNNYKLLLVEDDEVDVINIQRILNKYSFDKEFIVAYNGEEALNFLKNNNINNSKILIVLDLNMPIMNGFEFLKELRNDKNLFFIPTVILTTSNNKKDIENCYNLNVAGYLIKPLIYKEFEGIILDLIKYWDMNEIPLIGEKND